MKILIGADSVIPMQFLVIEAQKWALRLLFD